MGSCCISDGNDGHHNSLRPIIFIRNQNHTMVHLVQLINQIPSSIFGRRGSRVPSHSNLIFGYLPLKMMADAAPITPKNGP